MDLSKNQFQGHISQIHFNSTNDRSRLVYLDLSENQLSDEIFQDLCQAPNPKYLNLAFNRFTREVFQQIDMLSELEYLNLSKTSLAGHIPSEIAQLSSLHTLDLSQNHLSGQIPLLTIKKLKVLDVSNNNLSGEIPVSLLQKLPWMERYNFSYNNLTLCGTEFSFETFQTLFHGSLESCPIAANPGFFKRKVTNHKGLMLALGLSLSLVFFMVVKIAS